MVSPVFFITTQHHHHQQGYPVLCYGSNPSSKPTLVLNRNRNRRNTNNIIIPFPSSKSNSSRRRGNLAAARVVVSSDPAEAAQISWHIVVGALAGVTPFVVAGIEFGKRINAQRKCKRCRGSGLVLRDNKYYFRCPRCGGFLPWQSWTRFFTG